MNTSFPPKISPKYLPPISGELSGEPGAVPGHSPPLPDQSPASQWGLLSEDRLMMQ